MKKINLNDYPIGTGVTQTVGSDRYPYEVVKNISPSKIVIREMKEIPTKDCEYYGKQSYTYESTNEEPITIELGKKNGKTIFKKVVHKIRLTEMYYEVEKNNGGFDTFAETNLYNLIWLLAEQNLPFQGYTKLKKSSHQISLSFGKASYYRDPSF